VDVDPEEKMVLTEMMEGMEPQEKLALLESLDELE